MWQLLRKSRDAASTGLGHCGHVVLSVWLRSKEKRVGGKATVGRLTLVDLAASNSVRSPRNPQPSTLHPKPYTLHPTPYTPHPTPYTLHPNPSP